MKASHALVTLAGGAVLGTVIALQASKPNEPAVVPTWTPIVLAPKARIDFTAPCTQTIPGLGLQGKTATAYTDRFALWPWQWGFIAIDATNGAVAYRNGLGKAMDPYCSPAVNIIGDCWQSVTDLAASPNEARWVVAAGAPSQCHVAGGPQLEGLAVWHFENNVFKWKGLIAAPLLEVRSRIEVDGDYAWGFSKQKTPKGTNDILRFDLVAMTASGNWANMPPATPQDGIDGSDYTLYPNPPGQPIYYALWEGAGAETPTPGPSLTPSKSPTVAPATRTPTKVPTANCCDPSPSQLCPKGVPPCHPPTPTFIPSKTKTPASTPTSRPSPFPSIVATARPSPSSTAPAIASSTPRPATSSTPSPFAPTASPTSSGGAPLPHKGNVATWIVLGAVALAGLVIFLVKRGSK